MSGGRPPGSGALTDVQLRAVVLRAAADLWRASPARGPTVREVAKRIALSHGGLIKALRRHGLAWDELRDTSFRVSFGQLLSQTGS
jgi:hypothetical protein